MVFETEAFLGTELDDGFEGEALPSLELVGEDVASARQGDHLVGEGVGAAHGGHSGRGARIILPSAARRATAAGFSAAC